MSKPSIDIFFDSGLIPSLPPEGAKLGHASLMGRDTPVQKNDSSNISNTLSVPSARHTRARSSDSTVNSRSPSPGQIPQIPRPPIIRRVSSFDDRTPTAQNSQGVPRARPPASSSRSQAPNPGQYLETSRPPIIRRASSFDDHTPTALNPHGLPPPRVDSVNKVPRGHSRTASDSTVQPRTIMEKALPNLPLTLTPPPSRHTRSSSLDPSSSHGSITLGTDPGKSKQLLNRLHSLTPTSRRPASPLPGVLSPGSLVAPLSLVLEGLVVERSVLRDEPSAPLPTLPTGSKLTQPKSQGELDWKVIVKYIRNLGECLDDLMPYLQNSQDKAAVQELVKKIRAYISKPKKVFGECAEIYMDKYGFIRGWWDERAMKESAGIVGRWGDLFNV